MASVRRSAVRVGISHSTNANATVYLAHPERTHPKSALMMESEAFDYLDAPVERVTGADIPTPYAIGLEKMVFPQVEDIVAAVLRTTARGGASVAA